MKKAIALATSLMCLASVISQGTNLISPVISYAEDIIKTGKVEGCDTSDLTYTLDSEGTLTISGKGAMPCHTIFSGQEIKKVVIEDGVRLINTEDFYDCENLETIILPENGCAISNFAFSGCLKLKELYIPDTITGGLSKKSFGSQDNSFTIIGYDNTYAQLYAEKSGFTFRSLGEADKKVVYSGSLSESDNIEFSFYNTLDVDIYGTGKMYDYNYQTTPLGYTSVRTVTIKDGLTNIADGFFTECHFLTKVTLPDTLTEIGDSSFYECTALTEITIPKSVTSIGDSAFMLCDNLKTIRGYKGSYAETYAEKNGFEFVSVDEEAVTIITTGKVEGCDTSDLTYIFDSEGTLTISGKGDMPCHTGFSGQEIKKVVIEDGVTLINTEDFYDCENLETIILPENGCAISYFAFSGCPKLKEVYIPDSMTGGLSKKSFGGKDNSFTIIGYDNTYAQLYAEESGFTFRSLGEADKKVVYSGSLSESDNIEFSFYNTLDAEIHGTGKMYDYNYETTPFGYTSVRTVTIEDGLTNIADGFFIGCYFLTKITLPDTLTEIGNSSFYECTGLTEITIPESVTSIGDSAFKLCDNLKTIRGYKGSYAETYANEKKIRFEAISDPINGSGDLNFDDKRNIMDIVILQNWFYGIHDLTDKQISAADLNADGKLNIADMCLLKEKVLSGE